MQFRKAGAHYAFQGYYPSSGRLTRQFLHCINHFLNAILSNPWFYCIWQYYLIQLRVEICDKSREFTSEYSLIVDQLYRGCRPGPDICNFHLSSIVRYYSTVNWCNFKKQEPTTRFRVVTHHQVGLPDQFSIASISTWTQLFVFTKFVAFDNIARLNCELRFWSISTGYIQI